MYINHTVLCEEAEAGVWWGLSLWHTQHRGGGAIVGQPSGRLKKLIVQLQERPWTLNGISAHLSPKRARKSWQVNACSSFYYIITPCNNDGMRIEQHATNATNHITNLNKLSLIGFYGRQKNKTKKQSYILFLMSQAICPIKLYCTLVQMHPSFNKV